MSSVPHSPVTVFRRRITFRRALIATLFLVATLSAVELGEHLRTEILRSAASSVETRLDQGPSRPGPSRPDSAPFSSASRRIR